MAFVALETLYKRGKYILRNQGMAAFFKQGFSFVTNRFLGYGTYYLYEKDLTPGSIEIEVSPKVDCTARVISSPDEFDELLREGYDVKAMNFRPALQKGALAFCLFVGRALASVTWVALSEEAKEHIDYLPFKVNFQAGEVCSGASYTDPTYRGKGLLAYTYSYIFPHLAGKGIRKDKFSIDVSNIASQKAHARLSPVVTGRARYLKILWWRSWKERPIEDRGAKEMKQ